QSLLKCEIKIGPCSQRQPVSGAVVRQSIGPNRILGCSWLFFSFPSRSQSHGPVNEVRELGIRRVQEQGKDQRQVEEINGIHPRLILRQAQNLRENAGEYSGRQHQQEKPVEIRAGRSGFRSWIRPAMRITHPAKAASAHTLAKILSGLRIARGVCITPIIVPIPTTVPMMASPTNPENTSKWPQ